MPPLNIRRIQDGNTPLGRHPVLSGELGAALAMEEYERAVRGSMEYAQRLGTCLAENVLSAPRAVMTNLQSLSVSIRRCETGNGEVLGNLAIETVAEAYGLDRESLMPLLGRNELQEREQMGFVGDDQPPEPSGDLSDKMKGLIAKRRTHNAIIHGTGINHMNRALVLARGELGKLDPDLFSRYVLFSNLASVLHFLVPLEEVLQLPIPRAGRTSVVWQDSGVKMNACAESFPVLVQELSKGVVEINMAHGLPAEGELTAEEQRQFTFHADNELHEPYYFMMGPTLASRLQKMLVEREMIVQYGESPDLGMDLAYTRTRLAMLPEKELHDLFLLSPLFQGQIP